MAHSRALPPRLQNTHASAPRAPSSMYTTSSSSSSTVTLTIPAPSSSSVSTLLLPNQPWPASGSSDIFGSMSVVASGGDPWAAAPTSTPPPTTTTSDGPRTRKRSNTTAGLMRTNQLVGMPAVPVLPPRMRAVKPPRHQSIPPVSSLLSLTPPPGLPVPPHLAANRPRISSQLNNTITYANATSNSHSSLNPESPAFQPRSSLPSNAASTNNNKPSPPPPPAYLVEFMANKGASAQSKAVASALSDVTNSLPAPITPPQLISLPNSADVPPATEPTPAPPTLPTSTAFLASLPIRSHRAPPPPCRIVADMLLNRVRVGGGYRPRRRHFPISEHHRYVRSGLSRECRFDSRDSSPRGSPLSSPRIRAVELVELPLSAVAA